MLGLERDVDLVTFHRPHSENSQLPGEIEQVEHYYPLVSYRIYF